MSTTTREGQAMGSYEEWLAAMPVDDVRERVAQLESELALLRPLLAHAPKAAPKPEKVRAPIPPRPKGTRVRRLSPERKAIIDIVREHPDGIAPAEVARRLGKIGGTVQAAMWRMANDKQLVSEGGHYKLPPTPINVEDWQARRQAVANAQPTLDGSEGEAMEP